MRAIRETALIVGMVFSGLATAPVVRGDIVISEFMYSGTNGEFIEFTNIGLAAVDFAGWSFDDDSRTAGTVDLSAFGMVASGESVILTEVEATAFRTAWSLSESVKIIGGLTTNLGRNDEINIYNASGDLIDRLTYGDVAFPGTFRTQGISGNPLNNVIAGANDINGWSLSLDGDALGSVVSAGGDVGNPGRSSLSIVPEPSAITALGLLLSCLVSARRRGRWLS